ncbi:MAG: TrkH family potassium uptake protein [Oscillospiraceae bacterium]|nr:TrkH family potassium uptake protein [Oscillospiraceae bacterium]
MNYRIVLYIIGHIMRIEGLFMVVPLIIAVFNREETILSYIIPIILLLGIGTLLTVKKPENRRLYAKEGLVIVGLTWIILSLFGALPFIFSSEIKSFTDAVFEMVSAFTTSGASVLGNVEILTPSQLFWRSFAQWIGGMGILVFVLAILPQTETQSMYIMRAEVPGPVVGKLVSKIRLTARILYGIYVALTIVVVILLLIGGMPLFDSVLHAFGTAATGGFSIKNSGIAYYDSVYIEGVIAAFMIIFSINFNLYYLLLLGKVRDFFKSEELKWFTAILISAVTLVTINIYHIYGNIGDALRYSSFQVASMVSTTGYSTVNYHMWPEFSKVVLMILMVVGACAGSTCGGIKISRLMILGKSAAREIRKIVYPRSVMAVKIENKKVEDEVINGTIIFFIVYIFLIAVSVFLISLDVFDFETNFSAVIASINNIGPGYAIVGPAENYSNLSNLSKWVLMFDMFFGRLEIYPILILLSPRTWIKKL